MQTEEKEILISIKCYDHFLESELIKDGLEPYKIYMEYNFGLRFDRVITETGDDDIHDCLYIVDNDKFLQFCLMYSEYII